MYDIKLLSKSKQKLLYDYTENDNKKLNAISKNIFCKFGGICQVDHDDFYSIANEQLMLCIWNYDETKNDSFENYLKFVLNNKFKQEMTKRNRAKRCQIETDENGNITYIHPLSLDAPIEGEDGEKIFGSVATKNLVENEFFPDETAILSENTKQYLNSLSENEKSVAKLIMNGYETEIIKERLHLSDVLYKKIISDMKSFEKSIVLRQSGRINESNEREEKTMGNLQTLEKSKDGQLGIFSIIKKIDSMTIRFNHPLQRSSEQWDSKTKGNLISDILQGNPIPEIVLAEQVVNGIAIIWNIDGKQRCTTVQNYKYDGFKISKNITRGIIVYQEILKDENGKQILDENGFPITERKEFDIRGKKFSELPEILQEKFLDYEVKYIQYLQCSSEDIAYHIARYNNGRPMNSSQKGITRIGEQFATMVKNIGAMPFFKEKGNYSVRESRNGAIDRVVVESVMASEFLNDWKKKQEDMCEYLKENATEEMFENFEDLVERLTNVGTDEVFEMFNSKNSFLYFGLFARFVKDNDNDNEFVEFMAEFNQSLHNKKINGVSYDDLLEEKSTKDKTVVVKRLNHLIALMEDYLSKKHNDCNTVESEVEVNDVAKVENNDEIIEEENTELSFLQNNVSDTITNEDLELYKEVLNDLILNVDNNTRLLDKENLLSLLGIVAFSFENDIDLDKWIVEYFDKNKMYMLDQSRNYSIMKNDVLNFYHKKDNAA